MTTYDVYEVYFHGPLPEDTFEMSGEEVYEFVTEHGDWDNVATYTDAHEAWSEWNRKWSEMSDTDNDPDEDKDFLTATVMILEVTERNENEEPVNSHELDYSVCALERS